MRNIELVKRNVKGVEKSFLIKDGEIRESDFEEEKVHFLCKSIPFLVEYILKCGKDIRKMSIITDRYCQVFFRDTYILGVVVSKEANFPLLDMISYKLLYTIEEPFEKAEEAVDEVLQRMNAFFR